MQTVLRHSGRLCTRVSKRRIQRFSSAAIQRTSNLRPEDRDRTQRHDTTARSEITKEHDTVEDTTEPGEGRRNGFRRTLRRKPIDVPKPPALPAWFLKRNVVLLAQLDGEQRKDGALQSVECVDVDSGKTVFSLSCSADVAAHLIDNKQAAADISDRKDTPDKASTSPLHHNAFTPDLDAATAANVEIEAIINATFSLAGQSLPVFAGSKSELSIQIADTCGHAFMDGYVTKLAKKVGADLIQLDANDMADLTEDYVGQGNDSPGTFSTLAHEVFDGNASIAALTAAASAAVSSRGPFEEIEEDEDEENVEDEEEDDEDDEPEDSSHGHKLKVIQDLLKGRADMLERGLSRMPVAFSFAMPAGAMPGRHDSRSRQKKNRSTSDYVQWDDARLTAVLEQLLYAPHTKRQSIPADSGQIDLHSTVSLSVAELVYTITKQCSATLQFQRPSTTRQSSVDTSRRTIVHVRDLNDICKSKLGEAIVTRLAKVVQKRRRLGEQILIVGSSTTVHRSAAEMDDSPFIPLLIPRLAESLSDRKDARQPSPPVRSDGGYHRIMEINMRNIASMLRRLLSDQSPEDIFALVQDPMFTPEMSMLGDKILSQEIIHRLVLTSIGLTQTYTRSEAVRSFHIALAISILRSSEYSAQTTAATTLRDRIRARFGASDIGVDAAAKSGRKRIDQIRQNCNPHETRLLGGVVDAQNIKTNFNDVHVAPETIEALKTLTSLSLLRPDAFKYGILAKDNLSGLMLYGPPGTGKTLLAKAVAKESKATVLEVSGAQVYEKYVGEGEKMVRAVFTLAKKLSPCIVFIDEADALFGTRNSASNRSTHRELINQFLREWDGMDDHKIFIMVATNRPFDVDDAVLRRLPRRLLVDLPVAKDRENILGIHLRDETLDPAVALPALAAQTPLYSGSDLKNLCVAAALAAVREENDLVAQHAAEDKHFTLPEKRTLRQRHFDKGLQEISASISEDMSSLNAIRKFDEQYGDRKGRRKRSSYGFGASDAAVDENAARVRQ